MCKYILRKCEWINRFCRKEVLKSQEVLLVLFVA